MHPDGHGHRDAGHLPAFGRATSEVGAAAVGLTAIAVVAVGIFLFPLYWIVSTSLKSPDQIFTSPPTWAPIPADFSNYATAVFDNPLMIRALGNSVIISIGATLLTLVLAAPAAYGLARMRLRWTALLLLPFLWRSCSRRSTSHCRCSRCSRSGAWSTPTRAHPGNTVGCLPFAVIVLRPFYLRYPGARRGCRGRRATRAQAFLASCSRLSDPVW